MLRLFDEDGPEPPFGAPVGELLTVAFMLGRIALGFERMSRPVGLFERERERIPELMNAGWRVFEDWPNGFHSLLDARREPGRGVRGVKQAFGDLSTLVHAWCREPWGEPLGKAFAEYVAAQNDVALSTKRLERYAPGVEFDRKNVSLPQAAQALGIGAVSMMTLAKRRGLLVLEPRKMGDPSLLRSEDVRALSAEMNDFILPSEAMRILGVTSALFAELEKAALIRRVPKAECVMTSKPFLRSEVTAFVEACVGKAPRISAGAARARGLTQIGRPQAPGHGSVNICRALGQGLLKAKGVVATSRGLTSIRIDPDELYAALPSERTTLSIEDAARDINVHLDNLRVWVRRGMLKADVLGGRAEKGLRILPSEWRAFRDEYVAGTDLTQLFGKTENHWLTRHLTYQGVRPVSGPDVDGAQTCLFRRVDCNADVLAAIGRVRVRPTASKRDLHKAALERASKIVDAVESHWRMTFKREGNLITEPGDGRVVQIVTGRRPGMTGVFRFMLQQASVRKLRCRADAWVALAPAQGDTFLLVPFGLLEWRGKDTSPQYVCVLFDVHGTPQTMVEHAVTMTAGEER